MYTAVAHDIEPGCELKVRLVSGTERTDNEIARAAVNAL